MFREFSIFTLEVVVFWELVVESFRYLIGR